MGASAIWLAMLGPDTPARGVVREGQLYQRQVAKTVAALLGYNYVSEKEEVGGVVPGVIAIKK